MIYSNGERHDHRVGTDVRCRAGTHVGPFLLGQLNSMPAFEHHPHPWIKQRQETRPAPPPDARIGFNGRLGRAITQAAGTMWAFYAAALFMGVWMVLSLFKVITFDPYPFAFLLFLGNIVQLLLMFVIMVGQQVLAGSSDQRALQTYKDAEAILAECLQLQTHLQEQDKTLMEVVERVETMVRNGQSAVPARA